MSLSIAERQEMMKKLAAVNNASKALVATPFVISENLGKLYVEGIARNPNQLNIIESLVEFNVKAGFLTPKQQQIASQIILQNADFFKKQESKSEADDSTEEGSTDFPV